MNECGLNTNTNTNTKYKYQYIHSSPHGMQRYHDDVLSVGNQWIPNPGWFFRPRHRLLRDR